MLCLANNFSTGSDDDRVHLNSEVTKIEYNDDCVCVKVTENGANRPYCAPYAIVTFSMGVVQSEQFRNMVSPPFSQAKLDATKTFSMAHLLKIYAVFEERFWDDDTFYIGHVHDDRGYYPVIIPLHFTKSELNATLLVVTESLADQIVGQDQTIIKKRIADIFRGIYGRNMTSPTKIIVENFSSDPFFRGSFSTLNVGVNKNTFRYVSSPEGRLHFAGEAYHEKYSGYVHGAYLSGINTANVIAGEKEKSSGILILPNALLAFILTIIADLVVFIT